jgi:uncharacterized membrane protein
MQKRKIPTDLALVIFLTLLCIPFVLVRSAIKRNFAGKDYLGFTVGALSTRLRVNRYLIPAEGRFRWDRTDSTQLWVGLSIPVTPLLGLGLNYTTRRLGYD